MMASLFPLEILNEQVSLLTAIVLGFGFGFALERAGFGSPRKLAAQFYLYDMTVFKLMFTAILVAMVGFYAGVAVGWVDPARMWINPTFVWAQLIGGFLLGVGFIVSGLCPGTSVVSMASGRIDAAFAFAGVFFGTFLFAVLVDAVPAVDRLYEGGSWGVAVLPALLGLPAWAVVLGVVVMAGLAFAGIEKLERRFQKWRPDSVPAGESVDSTSGDRGDRGPARGQVQLARKQLAARWAMIGALAALALTSGFARPSVRPQAPPRASSIEPLELAEALVGDANGILVIDLRPEPVGADGIPGAIPGTDAAAIEALLQSLPDGATVVVFDGTGTTTSVPEGWPARLQYRLVRGGFQSWKSEVLSPRPLDAAPPGEREAVLRQNALAAYFSGTELEPVRTAPPPIAVPSGARKDKKKPGGC
jgi:uncharacterized protein